MKYDYLDEETGEKIKQEELQLHYIPVNHFSGLAPYLREKIRRDADRILKEYNEKYGTNYNLYKDGLILKTTLDAEMQQYAENAVQEHMKKLHNPITSTWVNKNPGTKIPRY